jgi:hypothetical protein
MADAPKAPLSWPTGSWRVLTKLIRAWYTAEDGGGEWTQRTVARLANMQPSRVSVNKAFLQAMGIVQTEGIALTEAGKSLGLGLHNENARVTQQALQTIVRDNPILKQLFDIVRSRGTIDKEGFEAEVLLLTKQGRDTTGFKTGVGVLENILLESGLVGMSDNALRPTKTDIKDERPLPKRDEDHKQDEKPGLRQIPIPVNASTVWYIEVGENPEDRDLDKFIEMQKLIFGKK